MERRLGVRRALDGVISEGLRRDFGGYRSDAVSFMTRFVYHAPGFPHGNTVSTAVAEAAFNPAKFVAQRREKIIL